MNFMQNPSPPGCSLAAAALGAGCPVTYTVDNTHTFRASPTATLATPPSCRALTPPVAAWCCDAAAKTGSVDITIDAKSVNTGYATFNEHIQGEDFWTPPNSHRHLQIHQGDLQGRQAGEGGRQSDPEGRDQTGDADRDLVSSPMAHPMLKKPAIGANAFTVVKLL